MENKRSTCANANWAYDALGSDINVGGKGDMVSGAAAQTALMEKADRYTLAMESHGTGAWNEAEA